MDAMTLIINGEHIRVNEILDINNGKALTVTKRWYDIVCDQCEIDYEQPTDDYIVCNRCNKVTYVKDLRP